MTGQCPCAIIAYDLVRKIDNWFLTHLDELTFPGMEEAISSCLKELLEAGRNHTRDGIIRAIRQKIAPAYDYFKSRILEMLKDDMVIYKTMRYTNPIAMIKLKANFSATRFISDVKALLYFTPSDIDMMLTDLPEYLESLDNIPKTCCEADEMKYAAEYWKCDRLNLPGMTKLARYSFTMITSSASAESAFSVLKRCFSSDQRLALEDYVMLSCMLQINRRNAE